MSAGTRLRELRERMRMSQTEFGSLIGVAQTTLSSYEKGTRKLSYDMAKEIASICKVDIHWLYDGDDSTNQLMQVVSEPQYQYGFPPIVSKVGKDRYSPADIIGERKEEPREAPIGNFYLKMPDDSLKPFPKSIKEGDLLLVNPELKVFPGDLVAIATKERNFVKFIEEETKDCYKLTGGIILERKEIEAIYRITRVIPVPFGV